MHRMLACCVCAKCANPGLLRNCRLGAGSQNHDNFLGAVSYLCGNLWTGGYVYVAFSAGDYGEEFEGDEWKI